MNLKEITTSWFWTLSIEQFHLVTHDWGVLIGTRWVCTYPGRIQRLIISDSSFSPDFEWHKDALIIRSRGGGEQWVQNKPVFEGFMKRLFHRVKNQITVQSAI